jgi:hypothetical protein
MSFLVDKTGRLMGVVEEDGNILLSGNSKVLRISEKDVEKYALCYLKYFSGKLDRWQKISMNTVKTEGKLADGEYIYVLV